MSRRLESLIIFSITLALAQCCSNPPLQRFASSQPMAWMSRIAHRGTLRSPSAVRSAGYAGVGRHHTARNRQEVRMSASFDLSSEFDGDDSDDYVEMVRVNCPTTSRYIDCYVEREEEIEGAVYAVVCPCDQPVVLACETESGRLEAMDNEDQMIDEIFPTVYSVLAEHEMMLLRTAVVLTLEAEDFSDDAAPIEEEEEEEEEPREEGWVTQQSLDLDTTQLWEEEEEEDLENEDAMVVTSFFHESRKYFVMAPTQPVHILARQDSDGEYVLPDQTEMDKVNPIMEARLKYDI